MQPESIENYKQIGAIYNAEDEFLNYQVCVPEVCVPDLISHFSRRYVPQRELVLVPFFTKKKKRIVHWCPFIEIILQRHSGRLYTHSLM